MVTDRKEFARRCGAVWLCLATVAAAQTTPVQAAYSDFRAEPVPFLAARALATFGDAPDAAAADALATAAVAAGVTAPAPEELRAFARAAFASFTSDEPPSAAGPYGDVVLALGDGATPTLADASGKTVSAAPPHSEPVTCAARDGRWFATGGRDRAVKVLRRGDDGVFRPAGFPSGHSGARNWISATAIRDDGAAAMAAAGDVDGRLVAWRVVAPTPRRVLDVIGHDRLVFGLRFVTTRRGEALLSLGADGVARLTPLPPDDAPIAAPVHEQDVRAVAFAPDGALLSAGVDLRVIEHGPEPRRGAREIPHPLTASVVGVAVSTDGALAAAAAVDGAVYLFPRGAGAGPASTRVRRLGVRIGSLAFRPGTRDVYLGCGDGKIRVVGADDAAEWYELEGGHRLEVKGLAFDATGARLVSAGADNSVQVRTFGVDGRATAAAPLRLRPPVEGAFGHWHACAFSPDGKRIAAGALSALVAIWDAETGAVRHVLRGHDGSIEGVCWSPDGARLLSTSADGHVAVWDAESGALLRRVRAGPLTIYAAAYDPTARMVATAGQDGTVRLFSAETFEPLRTIGAAPRVFDVAVSEDGAYLAAAYDDGLRLFELDGRRLVAWWRTESPATAVDFAVEGSLLVAATASGTVAFEIASGLAYDGDETPAAPAAPSPAPAARALAARIAPEACPRYPVHAFDERGPADDRAAAFAENGGAVRVVRRTGRGAEASVRVYECVAERGGAWSVREDAAGTAPSSGVVRADDGGRFVLADGSPAPPPVATTGAARLKLVLPEAATVAPGAGVLLRAELVNEGDAPAFAAGVAPSGVRDVSLFGLRRISRLDPGASEAIDLYLERRAAPSPAAAPDGAATRAASPVLLEVRIVAAPAGATAALLVRTP